jgi:hypothetical protein
MLRSIAGTYENGTVQLTKIPPNIRSSKVIVRFLDSIDINPTNQFITLGMFSWRKVIVRFLDYIDTNLMNRFIKLGMFSGTNQSTDEDFKIAEFQGDLK